MVTTKTNTAGRGGKAGGPGTTATRKVGATTGGAPKPPRLPKAVLAAVRVVRDKKGVDIVVLDLRKAGGFTDYFVMCTGTNPRQIHAIADAVAETLKDIGERPALKEGVEKSE